MEQRSPGCGRRPPGDGHARGAPCGLPPKLMTVLAVPSGAALPSGIGAAMLLRAPFSPLPHSMMFSFPHGPAHSAGLIGGLAHA